MDVEKKYSSKFGKYVDVDVDETVSEKNNMLFFNQFLLLKNGTSSIARTLLLFPIN